MIDRRLARMLAAWSVLVLGACTTESSDDTPPEEPSAMTDAEAPRPEPDAAAQPMDAAMGDPAPLCSGCSDEVRDADDATAHFHHVHLNTQEPAESVAFYERVFGAELVRLNDKTDVLKADGALLLLREVAQTPTDVVDVGLEHFGWGRTDLLAWWDDAQSKDGVVLDQRSGTNDGPFELFPMYYFLYLQGPSNERIEVETETPEYAQFKDVHFMTDDVDTTVAWYTALLGVEPEMPAAIESTLATEFNGMPIAWSINTIIVDKVKMIFFGPPFFGIPTEFAPTDDHPLGHVAFAFADLDAAIERIGAWASSSRSRRRWTTSTASAARSCAPPTRS